MWSFWEEKVGRGSSQSKEVAGALKFKKEDLQPNQALGDR